MGLAGFFKPMELLKSLPARKPSGRPRKNRGALSKDKSTDKFYTVSNLVKLFLAEPARALKWEVLKEFETVSDSGDRGVSTFLGAVVSYSNEAGIYNWTVRFGDDMSEVDMQAEELAICVRHARLQGRAVA